MIVAESEWPGPPSDVPRWARVAGVEPAAVVRAYATQRLRFLCFHARVCFFLRASFAMVRHFLI